MTVSKFEKRVPTWRVYPRVHYFCRRYSDLLPRFHRVINAFPESFHVKKSLTSIDERNEKFSKGLEVHVIGERDLDLSHIVVSTKPLEQEQYLQPTETAVLSVNICYITVEQIDVHGLKKFNEVLQYFDSKIAKLNLESYSTLFVVIDTDKQTSEDSQHEFRRKADEIVRTLSVSDWDHVDRIIFGSQGSILGSKISELFEIQLVEGFYSVLSYLEQFDRKSKLSVAEDIEVLHDDTVVQSIQSLLRDDIGLTDMRKIAETEKSEDTEGMNSDDKFLHQFLKKLARLVKCSIVEPLSAKHSLPAWVCNLLLTEINFESKLIGSISRNTRHHLRKLNEFSREYEETVKEHKRKGDTAKRIRGTSLHADFIRKVSYKFDFLVYPLQIDMSKVVSDAEKTLASASQIIITMGKMIFEIEGYLMQTITEKYESRKMTPDIPKELRHAILELKNVHAIGTVYNDIEIHVNDESDTLREDVSTLMKKYEYRLPFNVKTVTQQPLALMADIQHENGKLIKSPFPDNRTKYRQGTLGAFVHANDNTLYGLTCAHVVNNPNTDKHEVFIQERGLRLKRFGISQRNLTINTGASTGAGATPLIDIAAVLVNPDFVQHCIRRMKDDNGINRPAFIAEETPSKLRKTYVYKYGGMSGLTKGIICSADFGVAGAEEGDYLLMIESLPGDANDSFAKKGDSGAVICTSAVDTDSIKVVGMLSAGDYKVDGKDKQEKYMSFLMKTGLQKLRDRSNVLLNVA